MSNLTIGLAVIGGLVLAGVVAHGAWTARRRTPKVARARPAAGPGPGAPDGEDGRIEPTLGAALGAALGPGAAAALAVQRPGLDALIDAIAPLSLDHPVSGDAALAAYPATRRAGSKPFAIEGLNSATQQWEHPVAGQRYSAFQAGVQLASRNGALNEIEFSEFVQKTQAFADTIGAEPDFPEMLDEVARGRELDQFASAHDAQLSLRIQATHIAWSPGYVQQHAARLGFVAGAIPGRLVLPSSEPGLPPILGLAFDTQAALADDPEQSALREITLSLDVPQVKRAEQPFVRMRDAAVALAARMEGMIADDQGQRVSAEAMDVIGAELETLYDTLDSRDLSAGSALARRLFS